MQSPDWFRGFACFLIFLNFQRLGRAKMLMRGVLRRNGALQYIYLVDTISVFSICKTNDTKRVPVKYNTS